MAGADPLAGGAQGFVRIREAVKAEAAEGTGSGP